jgi:hypothetical protein
MTDERIKPYANLRRADLRGADLIDTNLHGANLIDTDLRGADLRGADLIGANLIDTDLRGANLSGANGIIMLGSPDGWHAHAWLRDDCLSIRVGCREMRANEAHEYWAGKANRREVLAAVEYAVQIATIRGWRIEP